MKMLDDMASSIARQRDRRKLEKKRREFEMEFNEFCDIRESAEVNLKKAKQDWDVVAHWHDNLKEDWYDLKKEEARLA